ncbi:putative flavoprotein involved in K+ transport [Pseudarthrobacter equi]|uniref:Putative flavoprotein involved in K+ transport n=1 Tax=Pseudarthrobacter equi TaxID=728066 RepID=A0A1H1WVC2_9MICC|nr:NAD(P)/FAD-dependent oxidoreductase [Pseudarthrobacter equi]SDT00590.1 putative flavoprotein involved in K+ transport [Pseudarthrobacter equi]
MPSPAASRQETNTVIVGAGQAGLATSYWLSQQGVEHRLLERRPALGGAWQDRWDSFYLNTPNFSLDLPGKAYAGSEPDGFQPRDATIGWFRNYAEDIAAPVELDTAVTRITPADGGFTVETDRGTWAARNVVLASGAFQRPRIPPAAVGISPDVLQLHSHGYRNPAQLPDGAVLVVGTGQSGGQITEDLLDAGRTVHLSVSSCPEAPRRYRGKDVFHWIMQVNVHGPEYGINALQVDQLPSPAGRFMCNPLLSGNGGGRSIRLRSLGRRGVRLHGRFEGMHDGDPVFTDDLAERLTLVEAGFGQRLGRLSDAYIKAAGIDAPPPEIPDPDDWLPSESGARLDLAAEGITSVVWCTGYGLDFSMLDPSLALLDEWNYPRHLRGVTEHPGLYAVGLPWLTKHISATLPGVGPDAEYVAEHLASRSN